MVKINKISITNFRRFHNIEFDLGNRITLIAGQNGTSKSTLLGMLCQPFSFGVIQGTKAGSKDNSKYTDNYHGLNLAGYKDLKDNFYIYDCENVFRLSNKHDTDPQKYLYHLHLSGDCITDKSPIREKGILVRAQSRTGKSKIRFVAGPKRSSEAGEGNFPHPVIYFGLDRHWPLALVKSMSIASNPEINEEDKTWFTKKYNRVLLLNEEDNEAEYVKTDKGDLLGISSADYNTESISAGQDNIGQVLMAILSFKCLKKKLKTKYQGGLILIDELDSTLHADAQMELLKILCEEAEKYQLQIIATTHSMYMLQQAFESNLKSKIKVLYLQKVDGNVIDSQFSSFTEIANDLKNKAVPSKKKQIEKVSIIFEDKVGRDMFWGIVGSALSKYCKRFDMKSIGAGYLKDLAIVAAKVAEFKKVILIPDGDVKSEFKEAQNIIFLPGTERPETLLYKCLASLAEGDAFWKKCNSINYTKKVAISKYDDPPAGNKEARRWYKNWYEEQSEFWGRSNRIAYEKWANCNKKLCEEFYKEFYKILRRINPSVPKGIIKK